ALLFCWMKPLTQPAGWLGLTSLLALAVTAYGAWTRAWFLTAAGQLLLGASVLEFFRQLYGHRDAASPQWFYALAPILTLVSLSLFALKWLDHHAEAKDRVGGEIQSTSLVYRS